MYYIFQKNKVLIDNETGSVHPLNQRQWEELRTHIDASTALVTPRLSESHSVEIQEEIRLPAPFTWAPLRSLVGRIDDMQFSRWSKASQILNWYKANRFCGYCGDRTIQHDHDFARRCPSCGSSHYPAVAPCVIVLVRRGETLLLARSPRFPGKMFSTLAGFIEPGETAEEAVHREIFEEVRIRVKNLRYFKSQSWPFPAQLMLGFFADFAEGEIEVDGEEICKAGWYSYDHLPEIPGPATIAGMLIRCHIGDPA